MKFRLLICLLTTFACSSLSLAGEPRGKAEDEDSVIKSIDSYVAAFNRRDVESVVKHWSTKGERMDSNGVLQTGRDAIKGSFTELFENLGSDQLLTVSVKRVSFVTPKVVMVEGVAHLAGGAESNYLVTEKFEDGKWRIHSAREFLLPSRSVHYGRLKELDWMIGDWIDQSEGATFESSFRWSKNQNFITQNFKVTIPGIAPLEGTQVIGFDASTETIRSWVFDSDGGIGSGEWSRKGETWEVRSSHVLADGRIATATNIYKLANGDQFSWRSIGRKLDGEFLPNTEPVKVQRIVEDGEE